MEKLSLNHAGGLCEIIIGSGLLLQTSWLSSHLKGISQLVLLSDDNVAPLYADKLLQHFTESDVKVDIIILPAGEENKTRERKQDIEDQLLEKCYGRDTLLLALGGGVITDITGFVAATYCRGIPVIYLPTTLLAMVDASIGGKTAVNTPYGKNMVGCFKQPSQVICDIDVLDTLSVNELANGLSEMIKHAMIYDAPLFETIQKLLTAHPLEKLTHQKSSFMDVLTRSCQIKCDVVARDEYESCGERQILNFGHTIAHAIERLYDYKISHGHAVHIGLWIESRISNLLGHLSNEAFHHIVSGLKLIQFSKKVNLDKENIKSLLAFMRLDKKAVNRQAKFVLLQKIGVTVVKQEQYSHCVDNTVVEQAILDWIDNEQN